MSEQCGGLRRLRLLGGFELTVEGVAAEIPRQAERLVGLLALSGRPVNRTRLAEMLWTDSNQHRAQSNLRNTVWHLRRADPGCVEGSGTALTLGATVDVDLHRLRHWASAAPGPSPGGHYVCCPHPDIDAGPGPGDVDALAEELLPGWDEEWLVLERERYRQWRLHTLERLSSGLCARGRYAEAIDAALLAVQIEPLRESAQVALAEAYLAEGNVSEALRAFRAYSDLLFAELRIRPTLSLDSLLARPFAS